MGCGASKVVASVAEAPSKIKLDQDQHTKEDQHLEQHPSRATSAGKVSLQTFIFSICSIYYQLACRNPSTAFGECLLLMQWLILPPSL